MYRFHDMVFYPERGTLASQDDEQVLRPKTAEILCILMEHANQLVTKEYLLETVWPDCHVSSGSLVQSIQEIRRALGDDAKNPRFVKTFPRRGYQWLVPVSLQETQPQPNPSAQSAEQPIPPAPQRKQQENRPVSARLGRRTLLLLLGFVVAASIVFWQNPFSTVPSPAPISQAESQRLILLPIVDETQNPSLEWMGPGISELLSARLQGSDSLQLLPQVIVGETLAKMGLPSPLISQQQAQSVMQQLEGHLLLQGRIQMSGTQFKFVYQLHKLQQGALEGSFTFSNPLDVSGKIAQLFAAHPPPNPQGMRYSPVEAANKDYFRGKLALDTKSAPLAKRYFEAALLQDPEFEACRLALARTIYLMGDLPAAERIYRDVLSRVQPPDRAYEHIVAQLSLGRIDWRMGQMARSNQRIEAALALARKHAFPQLEARSLRLLSWHAIHVGHWKKHDTYQALAREISADFSDEKSTADALYYMGASDSPLNNFEQARHLLNMALDYYQRTGAISDLAYTYLALGKNRAYPPEEQIAFHLQAKTLFEQLGYKLVLPGIWEGLALCYAQQLQPLKFKEAVLKAHRHYETEQHLGDLANSQFLLSVAEVMVGLAQQDAPLAGFLERAEGWLDQCQDFHRDQQIFSRQGSEALMRGMIAMERNQLDLAHQHLSRASTIFDELEFPEGIAVCASAYAALALLESDWQTALDWSARAEAVYSQRPGFWQPYAIFAHVELGQVDAALQLARAFKQTASLSAMASATALYEYCLKKQRGEPAERPPQPKLLNTYFQSY